MCDCACAFLAKLFGGPQKVFICSLAAENKQQKKRKKQNFIYIEINNHWKPSVWAHSNVIYDVIHHFYREKTFSCLSLRLSLAQVLGPGFWLLLLRLSLAKDFLCRCRWCESRRRPSFGRAYLPYMRLAGSLKKLEKVFSKEDVNFKARLCSTSLMMHPTPSHPRQPPG